MAKKTERYSEVSPQQKKRFYIFLAVFVFGFVLLSFIGTSINENGFVILSFLAPLVILTGIVGISWSLYRNPEESSTTTSSQDESKSSNS